jgi:acyl-CoA synthetase (NDP forming)
METAVMGKPKKTAPKAGSKAGAKPTALTIRGSREWREWVERGADFARTDVAKLVDAALVEYLKARGFTEAPPAR